MSRLPQSDFIILRWDNESCHFTFDTRVAGQCLYVTGLPMKHLSGFRLSTERHPLCPHPSNSSSVATLTMVENQRTACIVRQSLNWYGFRLTSPIDNSKPQCIQHLNYRTWVVWPSPNNLYSLLEYPPWRRTRSLFRLWLRVFHEWWIYW